MISLKDFNFFSPYIGEKEASKIKYLSIVVPIAIILLIILGSLLYTTIRTITLKNDINSMQKYINSSQSVALSKKYGDYKKKYDTAQNYFNNVSGVSDAINKSGIVSTELMKELSASLPQTVSFQTITVGGDGIQIQGVSSNRVSIGELEHNLKKLDLFDTVTIQNISESSSNLSFNVKCTFKDVD